MRRETRVLGPLLPLALPESPQENGQDRLVFLSPHLFLEAHDLSQVEYEDRPPDSDPKDLTVWQQFLISATSCHGAEKIQWAGTRHE